MSNVRERWIRIERKAKNELRVGTKTSCFRDRDVLQTEQGAMIEVGAIVGANLLHLNDGDVLEVKLIMHRREDE